MSPSRVRSQPSPRSAHGAWMMHVHPHDALADPLPFVMRDTSPRPAGCSGLAFRELTSTSPGRQLPAATSKSIPRWSFLGCLVYCDVHSVIAGSLVRLPAYDLGILFPIQPPPLLYGESYLCPHTAPARRGPRVNDGPTGADGNRGWRWPAPSGVDRQGRSRSECPGLPRDEARLSALTEVATPERIPVTSKTLESR